GLANRLLAFLQNGVIDGLVADRGLLLDDSLVADAIANGGQTALLRTAGLGRIVTRPTVAGRCWACCDGNSKHGRHPPHPALEPHDADCLPNKVPRRIGPGPTGPCRLSGEVMPPPAGSSPVDRSGESSWLEKLCPINAPWQTGHNRKPRQSSEVLPLSSAFMA